MTITIEEAQSTLKDLIHRLAPGEAVVITEGQKPVAKITGEPIASVPRQRPEPGFMKGQVLYMAPDFNEPLDDLKEYME